MVTLLGVLGVLVVVFLAAVLVTRDRPLLVDAPPDRPDLRLPEGTLTADDLELVQFGMALRGYRMAEVDAVLDRAAEQLRERDALIARLREGDDPSFEAPYEAPFEAPYEVGRPAQQAPGDDEARSA